MPNLHDEARAYVESVLGITACLKTLELKLPFYLRDEYETVAMTLQLGSVSALRVLLLVPVNEDTYPGAIKLEKHLAQVRKATEDVIVYVCRSLKAQERRSLIGHHINFIQPGYQMYIPELAMDLRENFRIRREHRDISVILPAAQAMLLSCLYSGKTRDASLAPSAILGDLNYSRVTLSKAVDQLAKLSIIFPVKSDSAWKTYAFHASPAEVFSKAKRYLRSPVRQRFAVDRRCVPFGTGVFVSGETALAKYSMLAEPVQPVFGMTKKVFLDMLALDVFAVTESIDEIQAWVEIWAYPSLSERSSIADEASLLLSLEGNPDERIQIALDELKEQVTWLASGV